MKKITFFAIAFLGFFQCVEAQTRLSIVPRLGATWGNMLFTNALTSHVTRYQNPTPAPSTTNPSGSPTHASNVVAVNPPLEFQKHGLRSRFNDQVTRIGFTAGVGLNIAVEDKFSVQVDLSYVQKGARYINNDYIPTVDSVTNLNKETHLLLNYIELPVTARYHFSFGEKIPFKAYIGGGMSAGAMVSGSYRAERYYIRNAQTLQMKEEGKIEVGSLRTEVGNQNRAIDNRFEFGVLAVAGLQYPVGNGFIVADVRYNVAINNLYSKGSSNIPAGFDNVSKNRVAQVTVGYMLPIGGGSSTAPSTGKKRNQ
jgi:opacity protein-like surface antigen